MQNKDSDGVKDLWGAFLLQMLEDSLIPTKETKGTDSLSRAKRLYKAEAHNFFFSTSSQVSQWRNTILADFLEVKDPKEVINTCRSLVELNLTWSQLKSKLSREGALDKWIEKQENK